MSGSINTPLRYRISSASGVVGPLAPSATIFARIARALSFVIWFSSAQGARMSTSSLNSSSLAFAQPSTESPPSNPETACRSLPRQ